MDGAKLDELDKLLEGQRGSRTYFEKMGWGESVEGMTPGVEALEWAIAELDRLQKMEARVRRLALQLHDPSVIQHSFHIGSDPELDTQKVWIAARIRQALDG